VVQLDGAEVYSVDEFQGFRMTCRNPVCRVIFDLPSFVETAYRCPSCRAELDSKLSAAVDMAFKALKLVANEGAIPELVFVRDPSLIQRSE